MTIPLSQSATFEAAVARITALESYHATFSGAVSRALATKLGDANTVKDAGAVGNGSTDDTAAIETWLLAQPTPYFQANIGDGTFPTTYAQTLQYTARFDSNSRGFAKIGARTVRFGDIRENTTLYVGSGDCFPTVGSALQYLKDRRIRGDVTVTIQVSDGTYSEAQLLFAHPDGAKISLIGNTGSPTSCILSFDATNNLSGIYVGPGYTLGLINGFKIVGTGARVNRTDWNTNCYGAGIQTRGGALSVGANMVIRDFYYSVLSDKGGRVYCSPGVDGGNAGDCVFHAREKSYMLARGCKATTAAHTNGATALGSGFGAEAGSFIDCTISEASDANIGGVVCSGNSMVWANGIYSHGNTLRGAVCFDGSIDLGIDTATSTATRLQSNNSGVIVFGGRISMNHTSGAHATVSGNTFDGIQVSNDGSFFAGSYIDSTGNGGVGAKAADGGRGRILNCTLTGNTGGATFVDSGNNSSMRTT